MLLQTTTSLAPTLMLPRRCLSAESMTAAEQRGVSSRWSEDVDSRAMSEGVCSTCVASRCFCCPAVCSCLLLEPRCCILICASRGDRQVWMPWSGDLVRHIRECLDLAAGREPLAYRELSLGSAGRESERVLRREGKLTRGLDACSCCTARADASAVAKREMCLASMCSE